MDKASRASVGPLIFRAVLRSHGAVARNGPAIEVATAINVRKSGGDVVVCGPKLVDNVRLAQQIEAAATGNRFKRHPAHEESIGPDALSHFQPHPRPPAGHTFYEDPPRRRAE